MVEQRHERRAQERVFDWINEVKILENALALIGGAVLHAEQKALCQNFRVLQKLAVDLLFAAAFGFVEAH